MPRLEESHRWMKRSLSSFEKGRQAGTDDLIMYEDLCFDLQQSAEKGLKAVCVLNGILFQKTHDISYLIDILDRNGVQVEDQVRSCRYLTQYAVETRYPGLYDPVTQEEYLEALKDSHIILKWASRMTGFDIGE